MEPCRGPHLPQVEEATSPTSRDRLRRELLRRGAPVPPPNASLTEHERFYEHFVSAACPPVPGGGPPARLDAARVLPLLTLFSGQQLRALLERFCEQYEALVRCCGPVTGPNQRRLRAELAHALAERVGRVSDAELVASTGAAPPLTPHTRLFWQKHLLLKWLAIDGDAAPARQLLRPQRDRPRCPPEPDTVRSRSRELAFVGAHRSRCERDCDEEMVHDPASSVVIKGAPSPLPPPLFLPPPPASGPPAAPSLPPLPSSAVQPAQAAMSPALSEACAVISGPCPGLQLTLCATAAPGASARSEARVRCCASGRTLAAGAGAEPTVLLSRPRMSTSQTAVVDVAVSAGRPCGEEGTSAAGPPTDRMEQVSAAQWCGRAAAGNCTRRTGCASNCCCTQSGRTAAGSTSVRRCHQATRTSPMPCWERAVGTPLERISQATGMCWNRQTDQAAGTTPTVASDMATDARSVDYAHQGSSVSPLMAAEKAAGTPVQHCDRATCMCCHQHVDQASGTSPVQQADQAIVTNRTQLAERSTATSGSMTSDQPPGTVLLPFGPLTLGSGLSLDFIPSLQKVSRSETSPCASESANRRTRRTDTMERDDGDAAAEHVAGSGGERRTGCCCQNPAASDERSERPCGCGPGGGGQPPGPRLGLPPAQMDQSADVLHTDPADGNQSAEAENDNKKPSTKTVSSRKSTIKSNSKKDKIKKPNEMVRTIAFSDDECEKSENQKSKRGRKKSSTSSTKNQRKTKSKMKSTAVNTPDISSVCECHYELEQPSEPDNPAMDSTAAPADSDETTAPAPDPSRPSQGTDAAISSTPGTALTYRFSWAACPGHDDSRLNTTSGWLPGEFQQTLSLAEATSSRSASPEVVSFGGGGPAARNTDSQETLPCEPLPSTAAQDTINQRDRHGLQHQGGAARHEGGENAEMFTSAGGGKPLPVSDCQRRKKEDDEAGHLTTPGSIPGLPPPVCCCCGGRSRADDSARRRSNPPVTSLAEGSTSRQQPKLSKSFAQTQLLSPQQSQSISPLSLSPVSGQPPLASQWQTLLQPRSQPQLSVLFQHPSTTGSRAVSVPPPPPRPLPLPPPSTQAQSQEFASPEPESCDCTETFFSAEDVAETAPSHESCRVTVGDKTTRI